MILTHGAHAACTIDGEHDAHYLGRDHRGVPRRCEGAWDEDTLETGYTGL